MRITRIDFEGTPGNYATAQTKLGAHRKVTHLEVEILKPDYTRRYLVEADDEDDLYRVAKETFRHLEGFDGTGSDVHELYRELSRLI